MAQVNSGQCPLGLLCGLHHSHGLSVFNLRLICLLTSFNSDVWLAGCLSTSAFSRSRPDFSFKRLEANTYSASLYSSAPCWPFSYLSLQDTTTEPWLHACSLWEWCRYNSLIDSPVSVVWMRRIHFISPGRFLAGHFKHLEQLDPGQRKKPVYRDRLFRWTPRKHGGHSPWLLLVRERVGWWLAFYFSSGR